MIQFMNIFQAITEAGLPMSTELVGLKLLVAARDAAGQLELRWDELLEICRVRNPGSATRHLARLGQTGVLRFAVDGLVTIEFVDASEEEPEQGEERAEPVDQIGACEKEAGAKAEAEEGVVVSSLGERDETETEEGDGRADLARGICSVCLLIIHAYAKRTTHRQTHWTILARKVKRLRLRKRMQSWS
ncbi:hypothetical protein KFU94_00335 [Chloroflexi bacterium TSY]|nr:hypothetical protein [Chloroflexi bacterium TSY]